MAVVAVIRTAVFEATAEVVARAEDVEAATVAEVAVASKPSCSIKGPHQRLGETHRVQQCLNSFCNVILFAETAAAAAAAAAAVVVVVLVVVVVVVVVVMVVVVVEVVVIGVAK